MTQNYRHQHSASKRRMHRSIFNGTMQMLDKRMCLGRFCPVRDLHSFFPPSFFFFFPISQLHCVCWRCSDPLAPHRIFWSAIWDIPTGSAEH